MYKKNKNELLMETFSCEIINNFIFMAILPGNFWAEIISCNFDVKRHILTKTEKFQICFFKKLFFHYCLIYCYVRNSLNAGDGIFS